MEPVIQIKNFAKSFGHTAATTDVNLTVNQGDIYGFLGRNGAGKSTTIRAMLSLIKPDAGSIRIFGHSLQTHRSEILSRIGSIVEKPDFYKYLSAKKNLEILGRLSPNPPSGKRIMEILEFTGLKGRENDKVSGYSHGMRQRLGIAQALLNDPDLVVLDEPTTGLDPQGIIDIRNLILQLRNEWNKTVILSSHILSEVELICNRLVIIEKGKTLVEGNVQELLHSNDRIVAFEISQTQEAFEKLKAAFPQLIIQKEGENKLAVHAAHTQISEINAWLVQNQFQVSGIESRRKLEDYFLTLLQS